MTSADWVLAHGLGGARDLPIPAEYAIIGAAWALVISFAVAAFAWRRSIFRGDASGTALPRLLTTVVDAPVTHGVVRALGLVASGWFVVALLFGPNLLTNPVFGTFYVLLWIGIVPLALLLGPVWRLLSPMRTLHLGLSKLLRTDPDEGLRPYPAWLGLWPAAGGLFAFVWLELVYPRNTDLVAVQGWVGIYVFLMLVGSAAFGSVWFARADPFEVFSELVARLSPFGRRTDGRLVVRNPLENLDGLPRRAGLVGVVAVLFGSTGYDSFRESPYWVQTAQAYGFTGSLVPTLVLLGFCVLVGTLLSLAVIAVSGLGHIRRGALPTQFAHSIVPIIVGYFVAHYLSTFVATGQQTLGQLSDPLGTGADLLGTAQLGANSFFSYHVTALAVTKVLAVVVGHLLGALAAHDRAVQVLPKGRELLGQLPLLLVMVCFTAGGLYLLLAS
ncbi:MAG TPA: hypothetical protein VFJ14_02660 [Nocardioidaceae bacterium]|nr:hypothetical protein [Nocardioidaceae bacterium]